MLCSAVDWSFKGDRLKPTLLREKPWSVIKSMGKTQHSCSPARTAQQTVYTQPVINARMHTHTHTDAEGQYSQILMSGWESKRPFFGSWFHCAPHWKSHLPQQRQTVPSLWSALSLQFHPLLYYYYNFILFIFFALIGEKSLSCELSPAVCVFPHSVCDLSQLGSSSVYLYGV